MQINFQLIHFMLVDTSIIIIMIRINIILYLHYTVCMFSIISSNVFIFLF